jgi:hypothetical protein
MSLKIGISFKENEKPVYNYIKKQLSPTIYIKQLVLKDMGKKKEPGPFK